LYEASVSGPTDSEPDFALVPLHAPLAVHDDASLLLQRRVTFFPASTAVGVAVSVTSGSGDTITTADFRTVPATPRQDSVYVFVPLVSASRVSRPSSALAPLQPPLAVQAVASSLCQVNSIDPPGLRAGLFAEIVSVGAGNASTAILRVTVLP
jgi:hypothetical protein